MAGSHSSFCRHRSHRGKLPRRLGSPNAGRTGLGLDEVARCRVRHPWHWCLYWRGEPLTVRYPSVDMSSESHRHSSGMAGFLASAAARRLVPLLAAGLAVGVAAGLAVGSSGPAERAIYIGAATALALLLSARLLYAVERRIGPGTFAMSSLSHFVYGMELRRLELRRGEGWHQRDLLRVQRELAAAQQEMDHLVRECQTKNASRFPEFTADAWRNALRQVDALLESTVRDLFEADPAASAFRNDKAGYALARHLVAGDLLTTAAANEIAQVSSETARDAPDARGSASAKDIPVPPARSED